MKRANFPRRRETRQQQAAQRQTAYDALTDDQKIARIEKRVGTERATTTNEYRKIKGTT